MIIERKTTQAVKAKKGPVKSNRVPEGEKKSQETGVPASNKQEHQKLQS